MVAASLLRRFAWHGRAGLGVAALRLAAVLVALLGVAASAWIARGWDATVARQRDERLDRAAASRTTTILSALSLYESALHAERSLWLASSSVSRQEFQVFVDSLNLPERYPGLQGIGWRAYVPDERAAEFVARARRDGPADFTIRPAGRRAVYYVTLYNEPAKLLDSTWGLDARATPSVLAALEQARDTGNTVMSGETTLWPDLLQKALETVQPTTGVELYDPEAGSTEPIASFPGGFRARGPDVRTGPLTFGGRTFTLRFAPLPGSPTLTEHTIPGGLVLGAGIAISVLLGALLWLLAQVSTLYRRVGRLARTDPLTGVLNRRVWDQAYNDRHGHQAGDRLLKAAGAAWPADLRETDLLVRYGGEEFAVLLPDCGLEDAMAIAERLRTALPEGTCSIGIAEWVRGERVDELVRRADRALYAAKDGGRDRSCASPSPVGPAVLSGNDPAR